MKKFLPFIIFLVVFAAVLAGQVGFKMFSETSTSQKYKSEYLEFESLFLNANYKDLSGNEISMTKINVPVVIYNFWASWCIPCLSEMPSMVELKKQFPGEKIEFIMINTDEDDQKLSIAKTMKKLKITNEFVIIPDTESRIVNQFKITAIPVTIVFHRGKVVHFSNGPMDFLAEEFTGKMKEWTKN